MQERQIVKNATLSVIQVMVSGVVLFVLYRYLLATLGASQLGIWSLVLATVSVTRISELGLSGSTLRSIARYRAQNDVIRASATAQTAMISLGVFIGLAALILYPVIASILHHVLPVSELELARSLLPYALGALWLSSMAAIAQSGLEGCQRLDLRAYIQMGAHGLWLLAAVLLVPSYG